METQGQSGPLRRGESLPPGQNPYKYQRGILYNKDIEGSTIESQYWLKYKKPRKYDNMDYSDVSKKVVGSGRRYHATNDVVDVAPI